MPSEPLPMHFAILVRQGPALGVCALLALAVVGASPAAKTESGQFLNVGGGVQMYYEVLGSGPETPLVIINGGPGIDHAHLHCTSAWDSLALRRRVVFYDQRGTGRSTRWKQGQRMGLDDLVSDLDSLRVQLGVRRMHLLGHSFGGYLAMAYAARHREHVDHLILCNSASPNWGNTINVLLKIYPDYWQAIDVLENVTQDTTRFQAAFDKYVELLFYSPERRAEYFAQPYSMRVRLDVNHQILVDVSHKDLGFAMIGFRFPTLVISGRYDFTAAPAGAFDMHNGIPESRLEIFERSGHLPFFEEPERFVKVVEDFLGGR